MTDGKKPRKYRPFCEISEMTEELLKRKMAGEELKEELKNELLNDFLERKIEFYKTFVKRIEPGAKPPTETLDELFQETIFEVWK